MQLALDALKLRLQCVVVHALMQMIAVPVDPLMYTCKCVSHYVTRPVFGRCLTSKPYLHCKIMHRNVSKRPVCDRQTSS